MKSQIDYGYYLKCYQTNEEHCDTSSLIPRRSPLKNMTTTSFYKSKKQDDGYSKEEHPSLINIQASGNFRPRTQTINKRISTSHKRLKPDHNLTLYSQCKNWTPSLVTRVSNSRSKVTTICSNIQKEQKKLTSIRVKFKLRLEKRMRSDK